MYRFAFEDKSTGEVAESNNSYSTPIRAMKALKDLIEEGCREGAYEPQDTLYVKIMPADEEVAERSSLPNTVPMKISTIRTLSAEVLVNIVNA